MADGTKIEWTDATWNIVTGCSVVSPGCTNCYAMKLAGTRLRNTHSRVGLTTDTKAGPVWNGLVRYNPEWLDQPIRWRRPRRIFVAAHGDLFYESVPDEVLDRVFAVMALAPQHTFQVLTKRAERMREYVSGQFGTAVGRIWARTMEIGGKAKIKPQAMLDASQRLMGWPLPNVWLGVSVEDQKHADERIPELLNTQAAKRFISAEPLLGHIDLMRVRGGTLDALIGHDFEAIGDIKDGGDFSKTRHPPALDWVIVGGESGAKARPMSIQWVREMRDQCRRAQVPLFFKQWGEWHPAGSHRSEEPGHFAFGDYEHDRDQMVQIDWFPRQFTMFGARSVMERVGKKAAGRLLDGEEYSEMPT